MLVQDVKAEGIHVDVALEFHLEKLNKLSLLMFYFITAQCKCNCIVNTHIRK